jgi:hypothetical protein
MLDDAADPSGKRHSRLAEGLVQQAELQVRVGVHQAGEQSHITQVDRRLLGEILADGDDLPAGERDQSVLDRRPIDRQHPAGAKCPRMVVAVFRVTEHFAACACRALVDSVISLRPSFTDGDNLYLGVRSTD